MRATLIALGLVAIAATTPAPAAEMLSTFYGGASVVGFSRRETRRYFDVAGTITLAFDQYSADHDVVLIHATAKRTCLDRGRLGAMGWIELSGRCAGISGLILEPSGRARRWTPERSGRSAGERSSASRH